MGEFRFEKNNKAVILDFIMIKIASYRIDEYGMMRSL